MDNSIVSLLGIVLFLVLFMGLSFRGVAPLVLSTALAAISCTNVGSSHPKAVLWSLHERVCRFRQKLFSDFRA